MGRESKVRKDRSCRICDKDFMNLTAAQVTMHAVVCTFEQKTGIEIIRMGEVEVEAEAPAAPAESNIIFTD